jgi:predicted phage baseplate assembly protein
MALPVPNLDDRTFQQLVDDSKRLVMRRCPEWTDHNVSDPGVTLIETFAYMTDQLLYRLNQVPDRLYVKFLELIGVRLLAPTPARAAVTFWLSAPAQAPFTIPTGTNAATPRIETDEPVVFATTADLDIHPCTLETVRTRRNDADHSVDHTETLRLGTSFSAFSEEPVPGDCLLIGLSDPVPSCAVRLQFLCHIDGVGVDPTNPPVEWEAWNGDGWVACDVDHDDTGGLNRDGEIVLHVDPSHAAGIIDERRAGWLRARVVDVEEGQPPYSSSPIVQGLTAGTVGGTVDAIHAEVVEDEPLGVSEGVPGQRFAVQRHPVLAGAGKAVLVVSSDDGWEEWSEVGDFAASGPDDQHFILDAVNGEVVFGPAVREEDGGIRQYGACPPKGATVQMRFYSVGGGRKGNVGAGAVQTLKSSIPFVAGVVNRFAAQGGVDGEDMVSAKARGPILLRTRSRAVTAEDFEQFTREAAPEVARVRCIAAGGDGTGDVRVLVVPAAPVDNGKIRFEDLVPGADTLERIRERLDAVRLLGTRVVIEPPLYRGVTVVARLKARPRFSAARIQDEAYQLLDTYLNPLVGGPDGDGWPWGRPVQAGEIFAVLQGIRGVELVDDARVFGANPVTGERGAQTQRLELDRTSLVFSYGHQLRVEEA